MEDWRKTHQENQPEELPDRKEEQKEDRANILIENIIKNIKQQSIGDKRSVSRICRILMNHYSITQKETEPDEGIRKEHANFLAKKEYQTEHSFNNSDINELLSEIKSGRIGSDKREKTVRLIRVAREWYGINIFLA